MQSFELRKKFINYFRKSGHIQIPSASLIPDNDPSVLLTTAGMQQLRDYLAGEKDPLIVFGSQKLVSIQKCFRTADIDKIGDESHHTFFEMLGNWSIGNYFKKEAIEYAYDFFVNELKINPDRLSVTVFKGAEKFPRDEMAMKLWMKQGIPKERIFFFGKEDNFWGPTGSTGPCGPSSELHYDLGSSFSRKCTAKKCGPNCPCGRFVEIWNLVFMEYKRLENGQYQKLEQKNVDTGAGLERLLAVLNDKRSAYETDLFKWARSFPGLNLIEQSKDRESLRLSRIVADHIRGAVFLIADGIIPARDDRGYILRRLIRRVIKHGEALNLQENFLLNLALRVIENYGKFYPELEVNQKNILEILKLESEKFQRTLKEGTKYFKRYVEKVIAEKKKVLAGAEVFNLYETYGFPLELTKELAKDKGLKVDEEGFQKAFRNIKKSPVRE